MSFQPEMNVSIEGFTVLNSSQNSLMDQIEFRYWQVEAIRDAGGFYQSTHPRFIIFFDDQRLLVSNEKNGKIFPSACLYIPGGHDIWAKIEKPGNFRHLDIHLSAQSLARWSKSKYKFKYPIYLDNVDCVAEIAQCLINECFERKRTPEHNKALVQALFFEFFFQAENNNAVVFNDDIDIDALLDFVHKNLDNRINVEDLAEICQMSRTRFNQEFREFTGLSPYQWVLQVKLEQAQKLLKSGVKLAEIAMATGFNDQAHFNRAFKSSTGMCPTHWKIHQVTG